jgi:hypothetical protein
LVLPVQVFADVKQELIRKLRKALSHFVLIYRRYCVGCRGLRCYGVPVRIVFHADVVSDEGSRFCTKRKMVGPDSWSLFGRNVGMKGSIEWS